jgi:hypothetical protein
MTNATAIETAREVDEPNMTGIFTDEHVEALKGGTTMFFGRLEEFLSR